MHAEEAARVLRQEHLMTSRVGIFLYSNRFKTGKPVYATMDAVDLAMYVNDTPTILESAVKLLDKHYVKGVAYKKAGVILENIRRKGETTEDLFGLVREKHERLSETLDQINNKYGNGTICFSAVKRDSEDWKMKREMKSPSYTTRFSDVLRVG